METATDNAGIDYGMGKTNVNVNTGIRYGVIQANEVPYWFEESEPYYVTACPHCGNDLDAEITGMCPICFEAIDETDWEMIEPSLFFINNEEIKAEQTHDDQDIFILKSKFY